MSGPSFAHVIFVLLNHQMIQSLPIFKSYPIQLPRLTFTKTGEKQ